MHLNSSLRTESAEAFQGETETEFVFYSLTRVRFCVDDQKKKLLKLASKEGG